MPSHIKHGLTNRKHSKEQNDNPFFTEHSILSNVFFVLAKIRQYYPLLLFTMVIGVISFSVKEYLWSFIGKYVIDLIQAQADSSTHDTAPLYHLVILMTLIELTCLIISMIATNRSWYSMIYVRMRVMEKLWSTALMMN